MILGHCIFAEAGCNKYILDVNIYSLSKNHSKCLATKINIHHTKYMGSALIILWLATFYQMFYLNSLFGQS
jgi:hypothetical protein